MYFEGYYLLFLGINSIYVHLILKKQKHGKTTTLPICSIYYFLIQILIYKKMKKIICIWLMNISLVVFCSCMAQESKSSLVFSGSLNHYVRSGKNLDVIGFYKYPVDPGFELLYQYQLSNSFFLSTGLNYQFGRIANWEGQVDRFRFGELSLPIIGKLKFSNNNKTGLFTILGFSYGQMTYVDWESPAKGNDWDNVNKKFDEHYSNDDSFADVLLGMGISFPIFHQNEFAITPYLRYRVNDNWMEYARKSSYYGIKFSYQLNFKRNEEM